MAEAAYGTRRTVFTADALGWALTKAGRPAEALPYVDEARRLGTRAPALHVHAAVALAATGDPARPPPPCERPSNRRPGWSRPCGRRRLRWPTAWASPSPRTGGHEAPDVARRRWRGRRRHGARRPRPPRGRAPAGQPHRQHLRRHRRPRRRDHRRLRAGPGRAPDRAGDAADRPRRRRRARSDRSCPIPRVGVRIPARRIGGLARRATGPADLGCRHGPAAPRPGRTGDAPPGVPATWSRRARGRCRPRLHRRQLLRSHRLAGDHGGRRPHDRHRHRRARIVRVRPAARLSDRRSLAAAAGRGRREGRTGRARPRRGGGARLRRTERWRRRPGARIL